MSIISRMRSPIGRDIGFKPRPVRVRLPSHLPTTNGGKI